MTSDMVEVPESWPTGADTTVSGQRTCDPALASSVGPPPATETGAIRTLDTGRTARGTVLVRISLIVPCLREVQAHLQAFIALSGVYTWVDGTKYDGQWKEGKREGVGTVIWPDGRRYDGEYKDGKMEGRGTFTWPDGSLYEGEYRAGRRHGFGTYTYRQGGGIYQGEWKCGNRDGYGTLQMANGDVYRGQWKENQPNGWGKMSYHTGHAVEKHWQPRELNLEP